ncbi:hypothetical protein [Leptolyngbya ohadii]|uniref:hypothetical protein n=1 Tax=Leptolyngbya ohadii TaxID=1962290 RepID=UPI0019D4C2DD|nr:hypothetical protein [Leptolyngbya ohadii]
MGEQDTVRRSCNALISRIWEMEGCLAIDEVADRGIGMNKKQEKKLFKVRNVRPCDYDSIIRVVDDWWGDGK